MLKRIIKKICGLRDNQTLNSLNIILHFYNKVSKLIYKRQFTTNELIDKLRQIGVKRGSNIFIHSSWDAFFNYKGNEEELIRALLDLIGPEGTLAMPAIPLIKKGKVFNIKKTVTKAGLLAEAFRTYPGVKRSINVRHSVCAIGPLSDYLLGEHDKCVLCRDEKSPYYKICIKGDFKVISFGLSSYYIGAIVHSVAATMRNEIPYFKSLYDLNTPHIIKYIDINGELKTYTTYSEKSGVVIRGDYFHNRYIVKKYFPKESYKSLKISNLIISSYEAKTTYDTLKKLAYKGIFLYVTPRP